ncbi:MAG: energy-coupling factor transporter transmembrane component T [Anaerolineae bacterium]
MHRTLAWLVWAIGVAVPTLLVRNPLYLAIIGLGALLVYLMSRGESSGSQGWGGLLKLGALVWLIAIPFNALMNHQGTHVLFSLPSHWPLVGGHITLEASLYGLVSGLAVWVLLVVFAAFNASVDASQLLRLSPPFLYQAGVITSIALTFVPQMLVNVREIREAQRVRGHRFRGWRDLLPLIMPLLTTGLEHAIALAESMESRGFGGQVSDLSRRQTNLLQGLMLGGLAAVLCGLVLFIYQPDRPLVGGGLMLLAALVLVGSFLLLGRRVRRSHYLRGHWGAGDTLLASLGGLLLGATLVVRALDPLALVYYPYPPYPLAPAFNPWLGMLFMLVAVPGVLALLRAPRAGANAGAVPDGAREKDSA